MNTEKNKQTVQQIYADFGAGNISGILNALADEVSWTDPGYPDIPYGSNGARIKNQVPEFFKTLADSVNYTKFEPREFFTDENTVIVTGYFEGKSKPKNIGFGHDWAMVWKFNNEGKVKSYKAFIDTNEVAKAFRN
jgi:ketosteroid isomerase-like protein